MICVLHHQLESADPLAAVEADATISVDTEGDIDIPALAVEIQRVTRVASGFRDLLPLQG